jgi:uncharacterized protein YqeY
MSLKEQIMADVKLAMKNKETEKLSTLRFVHSAIKNFEIEIRPKEITNEEIQQVLKKLVKQRKDSIEQYEKANRMDLADKEKRELEVIESYLPTSLSAERIAELVAEAIVELGANSLKDMGKVMKLVLDKSQGAADNRVVSEIVKAKLQVSN